MDWSNKWQDVWSEAEAWIDLDPTYLGLGTSEPQRRERYRAFVEQDVSEKEVVLLRDALQRGQLTGNQRFVDEVEQILGRRIENRGRGRPASGQADGK